MKKNVINCLFACFCLVSSVSVDAQPKYQVYDFSKTAPSGQTLYYKKVSGTTDEVYLCTPYSQSSYGSYTKPSGNVVVPETVIYGGHTYNVTGMYLNPFKSCRNLTSVTLPEGMNYFNGTALFKGCTSLETINLPTTMTNGLSWSSCFDSCWSLVEVNYAAGNSVYKSVNGVVFSYDGERLVLYPPGKNPGSPNFLYNLAGSAAGGLKRIGSLAHNRYIEEVNIPNTVTIIGASAFYDCPLLRRVVVGDGVEKVYNNAFGACPQIEEVSFGCSVDSIGQLIFYSIEQPHENTSLRTIIMKPITPPSSILQLINGVSSTPVFVLPCNNMSVYENALSYYINNGKITVTGDYLYEYQMYTSNSGSVSVTQEPSCWNGCVLKATAYPYSGKRFAKWFIQYPDGTSSSSNTNPNLSMEITSNIRITPLFENAVAIEEAKESDVSIVVNDGLIHIFGSKENTDLSVYSIVGQLVYRGEIHNNCAVKVPSTGVYCVSVGNGMPVKVVVIK